MLTAKNFKELCNLGCYMYLQHAFERREIMLRSFLGWLVSFFVIFNTMPHIAFFLYVILYVRYEMYVFSNKVYILEYPNWNCESSQKSEIHMPLNILLVVVNYPQILNMTDRELSLQLTTCYTSSTFTVRSLGRE